MELYNYLTRSKTTFTPLMDGFVGMYVCGPTVYGHAHIGHAKAYITFDVLHRYLEFLGNRVRYVQNITDVGHLVGDGDEGEDKIVSQAGKLKIEPMEVVELYTRSYFDSMDALGVRRPDISPRAGGHVLEQIALAKTLIEKGFAYESRGSVFFSVQNWPAYGKLSGRNIDDLQEGARVEVDSAKRDPRDFAVWRAVEPKALMKWESPWGMGVPGWHAECTVMARKYLGLPFDIHGGGLENIFPHNESEIAQCEAAYDKEFANYWVLNNMVTVNGTKMGKSLGNFTTIGDAMKKHDPMTIRFFILTSHYRSTTDFSDTALDGAARGYARLVRVLDSLRSLVREVGAPADGIASEPDSPVPTFLAPFRERFLAAMDDDLNTPQAIAALFDAGKAVNRRLTDSPPTPAEAREALRFFQTLGGTVLGLVPEEETISDSSVRGSGKNVALEPVVEILIELRAKARREKEFATADMIRDRLQEIGIGLADGKDGTTMTFL